MNRHIFGLKSVNSNIYEIIPTYLVKLLFDKKYLTFYFISDILIFEVIINEYYMA